MDSLPLSLEPRPFQGLLSGLIKKNFYSNKDITFDYLVQELYSSIEELEHGQHLGEVALYEKILLKAAEQNWDGDRLTDFLTQRSVSPEHVQVFSTVWSKESEKIYKRLLKDVTWNETMDRLTWRVDVRALSKATTEQTDEPVAFFELSTKKPSSQQGQGAEKGSAARNAKFEMNREEVRDMLNTLNEIDLVFEGIR